MINGLNLQLLRKLYSLRKHYLNAMMQKDNSFANEYVYLRMLANQLKISSGFIVDMAASDGVTQSCTLDFFKDPAWSGLAIEMNPSRFSKLAFAYENFKNAKLARGRVTPSNVVSMLSGFEVPNDFSILNLDIDSYDLYVIDAILSGGFAPKIISMEINEKIPPPIFFTVDFDENHFWQEDHFYGCSITAASEIVKPYGYILESLQYNNAIFIRQDICSDAFTDMSAEIAYDLGYKNKQDRHILFPYNANLECLIGLPKHEAIKFICKFFNKYDGMYTIR